MALWIKAYPKKTVNIAELEVARHLEVLPNSFIVVWGYYFNDGVGISREGDFLVICPFNGAFILEVKGGRLAHFAPDGTWEGDRQNPIVQLNRQWRCLIEFFQAKIETYNEENGTSLRVPFFGKALAYPDEIIPLNEDTVHGILRREFIGKNQFNDNKLMLDAFLNLFERTKNSEHFGREEMPPEVREMFISYFGKGCLPEEIGGFIDELERRLDTMVEENYGVLNMLENNRQLLFEGGIGTGKTWYAIEQARRYSRQSEWNILLLTYTRALTRSLREKVAEIAPNITVMSHEEFCCRIIGWSLEDLYQKAKEYEWDKDLFFDVILPKLTFEKLREQREKYGMSGINFGLDLKIFNAMVVDEAQDLDTELRSEIALDFPEMECGWWSIYFHFMKGWAPGEKVKGQVSLFFDEKQRLSCRNVTKFNSRKILAQLSQPARVSLNNTVRYTYQMFDFLRNIPGKDVEPLIAKMGNGDLLPSGPDVPYVLKMKETQQEISVQVSKIIEKWLRSGLCRLGDILILHENNLSDAAQKFISEEKLGEFEWTNDLEDEEKIKVSSIHKAKGLDSRAVILIGVEYPKNEDNFNLFMGASRAKILLAILTVPAK